MEVGEEAVRALGAGFDLTSDFRLRFAKAGAGRRLVELGGETRDVPLPGGAGGATLRGVPLDVGVDKGDRIRFRSDVLEFNQVRAAPSSSTAFPCSVPPGGRRRGHPLFGSPGRLAAMRRLVGGALGDQMGRGDWNWIHAFGPSSLACCVAQDRPPSWTNRAVLTSPARGSALSDRIAPVSFLCV